MLEKTLYVWTCKQDNLINLRTTETDKPLIASCN